MKILSITAQKPQATGSGTYLTELVSSFSRLGHKQAVIAGIYADDTVTFPADVAFYPVVFSEAFPIHGMSDAMPYPSALYSRMSEKDVERFEAMFTEALHKAVEDLDPDIIYCHHLFLLTAIVREQFPDRCVIAQCHGSDLRQFRTSTALQERIRKGIVSLDRIFALHEAQRNEIIELYGVSPDKVAVNGSGYNDSLFNIDGRAVHSADEPLTVIFAGKLSRPKGVLELFEAVRILSRDMSVPHFQLKLAGGCQDAEILNRLNELVEDCSTPDSRCTAVSYLGLLKQEKLAEEFKSANVFVLPSYYEGLGLVLIEAMASGLVPVATRLPGIKEWIDAEIPSNNVIYAEQPKMETVDKPFDSELSAFSLRLAASIKEAFEVCEQGFLQPDTKAIVWDAVAEKMLSAVRD